VLLNNLYQHTQLQQVFGINMVALVDGQPLTLNLKQILEYFHPPSPRRGHAPHAL
jgi:DNA gyrase subunit A